jgi:hypothetical protein
MVSAVDLQGYLAHEKTTTPLEAPYDARYSPAVGSWEGGVSDGRGTPVGGVLTQNGLCNGPTRVPRSKENPRHPRTPLGP